MNSVSVVVIHFDGHEYIERCLNAVKKQSNIHEIIFVDDGSQESPEKLVAPYEAIFIRLGKNRGPVAARNAGAARATGEYLLFLDVDAELHQDYTNILSTAFDTRPDLGVATGTMMDGHDRTWFNFGYDPARKGEFIGGLIDKLVLAFWHISFIRKFLMRIAEPFTLNYVKNVRRDVDWVIERGFMTRRNLFEKLNGLDEGYVMFFEGPDYCRRVREAGFRVSYIPEALCDHLGGHSHSPLKRAHYFVASRLRYLHKFPRPLKK